MTRHTKTAPFAVKAVDEAEGVIERVVSVFGNVDYGGDRVAVGAFTDTIERWKSSGDPIPVVFSHDWSNLDAHLGVVEDIKELPPGDPLLPEAIKDNGGLWVREKYDLHVPAAARAFELQARRSLKESSFAYETVSERKAKDGANDLLALELIEVGPCLKGMNPATQLIAAKSIEPADDAVPAQLPDVEDATPAEGTVPAVEPAQEPATDSKAAAVVGVKAYVTLDGSYELLIEELNAALKDWVVLNFPDDEFYFYGVEATYPDNVVIYLETWTDPYGRGQYQQASYARDEDGSLRIEAPRLVAINGNVVPKAIRQFTAKSHLKDSTALSEHPSSADDTQGLSPESLRLLADLIETTAADPNEQENPR